MKNKALGVLVIMVKIVQVLGELCDKKMQRAKFGGKLRRSIMKHVVC